MTISGVRFRVFDPRVEDVNIEDIAHSLAKQCRWGGHVKRFYSVAQHSVHVSHVCTPAHALWGLLHDATEAYLVDLPRPIKRVLVDYQRAEAVLARVIAQRFNLFWPMPDDVDLADAVLLETERRDLTAHPTAPLVEGTHFKSNDRPAVPLPELGNGDMKRWSIPWSPEAAKRMFLARYEELTGERT